MPGKKMFNFLLFLSVFSAGNVSFASESASENAGKNSVTHGEEAHENHCYKCHSDGVYTRDDRIVKSIDALSKQVVRCKDGNDIPWFDEDANAVTQFLNKKYYRF